jgi:DNA end-binding protein Ku
MAPRAYWKGYLRLSLVSFPVHLYSALDTASDVQLHQIHKPSGERVRYEKVVPGVGAVESEDIVLGYEHDNGQHVLLDKEDLASVRLATTDTIELEQFIDAGELDDIYVDKPYFLMPADKIGGDAYRVLRTALKETRKIGIGEVVLHRRERIVAVRPCGRGLMLETLRYAEELREAERTFAELDDAPADPRMVGLAKELIEQRSAPFEPARFKDDYEAGLKALIQAKLRGRQAGQKPAPAPPAEVIDLMQALKRSLDTMTRDTANANVPKARPRRARPARGA